MNNQTNKNEKGLVVKSLFSQRLDLRQRSSLVDLASVKARAVSHRLVRLQWSVRLIAFFVGMLLVSLIVPASPVRQELGYGGGSALIHPICGQPSHVFAQLRPGETYTLPTSAQLRHLPTPKQRPLSNSLSATYDPSTNQLCVASSAALDAHFGPATSTIAPATTSNSGGLLTGDLVNSILSGLFGSFVQGGQNFLSEVLADANTFRFMFTTPEKITYGHDVVKHFEGMLVDITNGMLILFLIFGGYNYMFGNYQSFRELAPKIVVAAIAANFCLPILGKFIELCNALCDGIGGQLLTAGIGNLSFPGGILNWVIAPEYIILVYLIYLIAAIFLSGQMLLRIALLDLLLVVAPLGLLCFALPQTRAWGTMWAQAFVATLISQFLQLLCLAIGSALMSSFGHASLTPITLLVGIATLFLAGKIPDMLLSSVLRSRVLSSSSADELKQNVGSAVQAGSEMMAIVAA